MTPRVLSPLASRLPDPKEATGDLVFDRFLDYVADKELELYPAQEEALLEIVAGKNVILNTPTGSGKSLVATAMHFLAMAQGKRSFYTCPIKALVSEKFFALCRDFGPDHVGMMTGDASVNRDAPIICCTAEILANIALREGDRAQIEYVIMDEFHYYADRERGVAWQIPLLTMPQATYLLMSATLGGADNFARLLTQLNGRETALVRSRERPVPLDFEYRETPLHETVHSLVEKDRAPIYIVCFTQRAAAEEAQNLMSLDYASKEDKRAIARALEGTRFDSPYGKDLARFVRHGIGLHHAGLLPKYRLLVEKLAQKGLLKVICGTDTLGVGVNIPIRTVVFTKLCKYDGEKTAILSVRDFQQISGRAGRKGFDDRGTVVAQAPEHVIENLRLEAKAGNDPVKKKRIVRKKPPEKGYVHWDRSTFERLIQGEPEPLVSRFQVSHGMMLNVLLREGDGCRAMKRLLNDVHETPAQRRIHKKTALQMFRSLVEGGVIELAPKDGSGRRLRVNADLQEDFSLNHALSLWLVETIQKVDPERDTYALDILTLVESILENPELILQKQLDKLKREKLFELKQQGVEYDDRIAELEKMEYPKPLAEFVYETFNDFARKHPWVGRENIRPKSIARDMFEGLYSFADYVKEYELQRSEGLVLRYLSDVYKALTQTVPDPAKTDEIDDIEIFLGAIVRQVDSSLIEEWERMRDPSRVARVAVEGAPEQRAEEIDITTDTRGFVALIRNEIFSLVRALSRRDYETAAQILEQGGEDWTGRRLEEALAPFWEEHSEIRTDPAARNPEHTQIRQWPFVWEFSQILIDEGGDGDWVLEGVIDLDKSRDHNRPVLTLRRIVS